MFLNIRLTPATNLNRLEEVLVITKIEESAPSPEDLANGPVRAADVLAQRLPSVRKVEAPAATEKPVKPTMKKAPPTPVGAAAQPGTGIATTKPASPRQEAQPPAPGANPTADPQSSNPPGENPPGDNPRGENQR